MVSIRHPTDIPHKVARCNRLRRCVATQKFQKLYIINHAKCQRWQIKVISNFGSGCSGKTVVSSSINAARALAAAPNAHQMWAHLIFQILGNAKKNGFERAISAARRLSQRRQKNIQPKNKCYFVPCCGRAVLFIVRMRALRPLNGRDDGSCRCTRQRCGTRVNIWRRNKRQEHRPRSLD